MMFKIKYSKNLQNYTKGEEIFNAVSHIVGGAFVLFAWNIFSIYEYIALCNNVILIK